MSYSTDADYYGSEFEIKVGRANNDDKMTVRPTKARALERRLKSNLLQATRAKEDKTKTEDEETEETEKEETETEETKTKETRQIHRIYQRGTEAFEKKKINENKRKQPRTHTDESFQPFTWNEHNITREEERLIIDNLCPYHLAGLGVIKTYIPPTKQGQFLDYALAVRYDLTPPPRKSRDPVYDQALPLADVPGYVLQRRVIKPKLNWKQMLQSTW
jgi:DNA mismatch repair ATPase MutL